MSQGTLVDKSQGHLEDVRKFADKVGKREHFEEKLKQVYEGGYFGRDTKVLLFKDFAPYSFYWAMYAADDEKNEKRFMNGGLIFHGAHDGGGDGGAPTFSVCLEPTDGWSIHT